MKRNFTLMLTLLLGVFITSEVYSQTVPEILYYQFDGAGTTVPNMASAPPVGTATATIFGSLSQGGAGLCGGALIGSGGATSTDYVSTGWNTSLGNNPWTISFWTNNIPNTTTLYYQFGDAAAGSFRCFNNGVAGAGNWMLRGPLTDVVCTGCAPVGNVPSMATFVYDPTLGNVKAYHNGVLVNTVAQPVLNISGADFRINAGGSTGMAAGQLMDEFRVYNRALDDVEVLATYNACLPLYSVPNDVGVISIDEPSVFCADTHNVVVTIKNFGNNIIDSCIVNWEINSVAQPPYTFYGSLDTTGGVGSTTAQITLGSYNFAPFTPYTIDAWTSLPNGVNDTITSNDSSSVVVQSALSGNFTIGATGDYLNFTDAVADLATFGVCGPVVFDVQDGLYFEQVTLPQIAGTDSVNTITFQSLNANPALVTLSYNGTAAADNQVVLLDGADYITFRNISLVNGGATYGTVIRVQSGAHNNAFEGNIIAGATGATTTSTNMALVYSPSGSIDTMNVFDGNDFLNGSYSMYWYGGNTSTLEYGTKIINNNFTDFYYRGIMSYYQQDVEIGGNTLMPSPTYTGSLYRLYMYYNQGGTRVYNNKIGGMNYGYGMYLSSCDGTAANPGYFYNNMVHVGDTNSTSTSYGIYSVSNDFTVVTNNSINVRSNGTFSRAAYYSSGNNNTFKNNSVKNEGPGFGLYVASGLNNADNNNVYVPNGTLYYSGGNINDLATWQANTGWGLASDTLDPMYFSGDDLHTCQDLSIDMGATPDSMVMYDIDGQLRDANTPDIGADEFLGMANLAFAEDTIWKCSQDAVTLGGWEPQDDATYQWSNLQTTPTVNVTAEGAYFVNVSGTCGNASPSVYVANIPDAVADFNADGVFMTLVTTNNSTGTIDTYAWDFGDGATSTEFEPLHVYADTGMYIVTLTVTGPCGSDTYTDTMYSSVVGLDEYALENSLNVYPNPNSGTFTLNLNVAQAAEVSAVLTDLQGKAVWSREMGTVNGMIEEDVKLSGNATGIYILKVTVDGESAVRRVVVK